MKILLNTPNGKTTGRYTSKSTTEKRLKVMGYPKNDIDKLMKEIPDVSNNTFVVEVE